MPFGIYLVFVRIEVESSRSSRRNAGGVFGLKRGATRFVSAVVLKLTPDGVHANRVELAPDPVACPKSFHQRADFSPLSMSYQVLPPSSENTEGCLLLCHIGRVLSPTSFHSSGSDVIGERTL